MSLLPDLDDAGTVENEQTTRRQIIDQRLKDAGWSVADPSQVIQEFFIQERYKGKLCKKRGAYSWLTAVLNDSASYNKKPKEVLKTIRDNVAADPFLDDGYLKLATLEACDKAGLIK
jgi:type I site-specific restriction endonuclease